MKTSVLCVIFVELGTWSLKVEYYGVSNKQVYGEPERERESWGGG